MNALRIFSRLNHFLARLLQGVLIAVFVILVFVVLWGVGSRYIIGDQASWTEELARLLMVWLALLGAALVCREEKHLGLDAIYRLWVPEVQRLARLLIFAVIFLFAGGIMAMGGAQLVVERFASGQQLPALGISKGWFYMALPVSGVLTAAFMLESFWAILIRAETGAERQKGEGIA